MNPHTHVDWCKISNLVLDLGFIWIATSFSCNCFKIISDAQRKIKQILKNWKKIWFEVRIWELDSPKITFQNNIDIFKHCLNCKLEPDLKLQVQFTTLLRILAHRIFVSRFELYFNFNVPCHLVLQD